MEEYICKNSINDKPCSVKLFEHHLEWQRGDKTGTFDYTNIVAVRLQRKGKKFQINIQSDYQGSITLSNRFYLSNLKFEDRSRHYNTFVRVLHHHLTWHSTATFFTGTSWNRLALIAAVLIFGAWIFQASLIGPDAINIWLILLDSALVVVVAIYVASNWPRIYSAENIPLDFLP
jgi:hypothetical protein